MKEYTQEKNHTAAHNVTKGLIKKACKGMKVYTQEKNHTVAHNVKTDFAKC